MSVLVVGSVAIDDVTTPFGRGERVLGGSASYFSLAASRFAPVRITAVVGEDFPEEHLDLLSGRGIDVGGVRREGGESFYWRGSYDADLKQAETHETRLGVFETFSPELREEDRDAPYVFLANIDPELQLQVLDQVRKPELVVLDTMNFWITGKKDALTKVLERVDVVLMNDEELRLYTGQHHLLRAARAILEVGPRSVVIKKGEHGAFLRSKDDDFALPSYPTEEVADPTGAGDTFAGGFVGYLASRKETTPEHLRHAIAHGVTMASFTVEAFSVGRLASATDQEIGQRLSRLRDMTHYACDPATAG